MVAPYARIKVGPQPDQLGTAILIPVTNAIERLHEEFKRRIKTQTVLPSAETAAMLFWALVASGQITMRKVDGWQTLATKPIVQCVDLAAEALTSSRWRCRSINFYQLRATTRTWRDHHVWRRIILLTRHRLVDRLAVFQGCSTLFSLAVLR